MQLTVLELYLTAVRCLWLDRVFLEICIYIDFLFRGVMECLSVCSAEEVNIVSFFYILF